MDMLKVPTLRKELEWITSNREAWDQCHWLTETTETECGTVGCLAGNAVAHSSEYTFSRGKSLYPFHIIDQMEVGWSDAAGEVLGLDHFEAADMFSAYNSLYRLWWLANKFSNGEIDIPPAIYAERQYWDADWEEQD